MSEEEETEAQQVGREEEEDDDDEEAPINSLPYEVLDSIFSFLCIKERIRTERVCKKWRLVGTVQPWSEPKCLCFDFWEWVTNVKITDEILTSILSRCGPVVRCLHMTNPDSQMTLAMIKTVCHQCRNLVALDLRLPNTGLPENCLEGFGQYCSKLEAVHLLYDGEGSFLFHSFFKNCKALVALDLSGDKLCPTGQDVKVVNKNLKCLCLNSYSCLEPDFLLELKKRCEIIETLEFDNLYNYRLICPELLMQTLLHYSKTLVSLDLTRCKEPKMMECLNQFTRLKALTIGWPDVPDDPLSQLSFEVASSDLRCFVAFGDRWDLDNTSVKNLLEKNDRLQNLCLAGCTVSSEILNICQKYTNTMRHITFEVIRNPCDASNWCELFASLSNLESLMLHHCELHECDTVINTLAKSCRKLKMLSIMGPSITDEGLSSISCLPCLTHLNLCGLEQISDEGISALAALRQLEVLDISRCFNPNGTRKSSSNLKITDESCCLFATKCPEFRARNAEGVSNITNVLVDTFCDALQAGFLKNNVMLNLKGTLVTEEHKNHDRLLVEFDNEEVAILDEKDLVVEEEENFQVLCD